MATALPMSAPTPSGARALVLRLRNGDEVARLITLVFASSIVLVTVGLVYELWVTSALARQKFGFGFLTSSMWNPVSGQFGALPFIYGTVVTSAIALIIAVPLGVGAAIFLAELAPARVSSAFTFFI